MIGLAIRFTILAIMIAALTFIYLIILFICPFIVSVAVCQPLLKILIIKIEIILRKL